MKILFMHPNMPGQYKYLCPEFAKDPENTVLFVTKHKSMELANVHRITFEVPRKASPHCHRYMKHAEEAVLQGQEVWRVLKVLKEREGFVPDIVVAHPGWGDAMFVKDIYPDTPLFCFFEFFYHSKGSDVGFGGSEIVTDDDVARVRVKNMHHMLSLKDADWGISPTHWQHSLHPPEYQSKISIIHDGINTDVCKPNPNAKVEIKGKTFRPGDELVTYVARNFEPYRGFPTFMRAAEIILKERPNCHIVAVGADDVSYGKPAPEGTTFRKMMMEEVDLDMDRFHLPGTLPYKGLITLLQASAAHIYLTYPFVLSWSSMEAMACGCAMVGSATTPVEEVITHGENGLLVDFFSAEDVANQVFEVLDHPTRMQHIRDAARESMLQKYSLNKLLPLHKQLVIDVAEGKLPPPTDQIIQSLYDTPKKAA